MIQQYRHALHHFNVHPSGYGTALCILGSVAIGDKKRKSFSPPMGFEIINPNNQSIQFQLENNSKRLYSSKEFFIDERFVGVWKLNLSVNEEIEHGYLKVSVYRDWLASKSFPQSKVFSLSGIEKNKYKLMEIKL